jgi:hypothetical protein
MKGPTTTYEIEEDNGSESSGSEQSDTGSEDTD